MGTRKAGEVTVVPAPQRLALLRQPDDVFVQDEDTDTWCRPSQHEESLLADYLKDNYRGAPKRFWNARVGTRLGYNDEGVFIHENHVKRYFGLDSSTASTALQHGITETVPMVNAKGEPHIRGNKTEQTLGKMMHHLPSLSDDMRYRVLKSSFQLADRNKNGKLSRPELGIVFRRVLNTMTSSQIEEIIRTADEDGDGAIDYQEFIEWLEKSAKWRQFIGKSLGKSLKNEADIVRATFRLWDKNGDGLVPNGHLFKALAKVHEDLTEKQVSALVKTIDCDHDGNVDYDEFVDFLFHKASRN